MGHIGRDGDYLCTSQEGGQMKLKIMLGTEDMGKSYDMIFEVDGEKKKLEDIDECDLLSSLYLVLCGSKELVGDKLATSKHGKIGCRNQNKGGTDGK